MDKLINNRLLKFEQEQGENIIFDIQSNIVYTVQKEQEQKLVDAIDYSGNSINDGMKIKCNSEILKSAKYEDGSNLAININLTPKCNLKCTYCFAKGGDYGSVEKSMNKDIVEEIFKLVKQNKTKSEVVRFEFFGGEPLLNFGVIKAVVDKANEISLKENIKFIYRISTNLTFINEEIIKYLGENNFIVSISIDGCKTVQDKLRPFKNDKGSYDVIMSNIELIRQKYNNLILVARMTLAQKHVSLIDNIKDLISTNYFDYLSIYPSSVKESNKYEYYFDQDIREDISNVINQYGKLFEISSRFKGILEYEKIYNQILSRKLSICHCSAGGTYFTLSENKEIAPCHRLCGNNEFLLNTNEYHLNEEIVNQWSKKVDDHKECCKCWARYICGGGCKQEHWSSNGSISIINKSSCEYHKFIISSLIKALPKFSVEFNKRKIDVDDLFVYCGRPIISNGFSNYDFLDIKQIQGIKVF